MTFDQTLWDARSAGYRDDDSANPYIYSSACWSAYEIGRAYGLGRIANSRGASMRAQIDGRERVLTFDEIASLRTQPAKQPAIAYMHGAR
jgi:hypothetical protein